MSQSCPSSPRALHILQYQDEHTDTKLQKELDSLRWQLTQQKRKNQKLRGNSRFYNLKVSWLNPLTSELHDDADEGSGPESEEPDEEPSAMQFLNAVGPSSWTPPPYDLLTPSHIQIRSKGIVKQPKKSKAHKATNPPPVHNGHHDITRGLEQNQVESPTMLPRSPLLPPSPSPSL